MKGFAAPLNSQRILGEIARSKLRAARGHRLDRSLRCGEESGSAALAGLKKAGLEAPCYHEAARLMSDWHEVYIMARLKAQASSRLSKASPHAHRY
jgi:hypothetical protein